MNTGKKNVNKDVIIKITLDLIEEKGGIKDVNLRMIARIIGCAHTNLYNYYGSFDEILWESVAQALTEMMNDSDEHFSEDGDPKEEFYRLISKHIDFSMKHPGWYRLIWLEAIGGEPSSEITEILRKPGEKFVMAVMKARNYEITKEEAETIADMIHGYLHGDLCKWINKRASVCEKSEVKDRIITNIKTILEIKYES